MLRRSPVCGMRQGTRRARLCPVAWSGAAITPLLRRPAHTGPSLLSQPGPCRGHRCGHGDRPWGGYRLGDPALARARRYHPAPIKTSSIGIAPGSLSAWIFPAMSTNPIATVSADSTFCAVGFPSVSVFVLLVDAQGVPRAAGHPRRGSCLVAPHSAILAPSASSEAYPRCDRGDALSELRAEGVLGSSHSPGPMLLGPRLPLRSYVPITNRRSLSRAISIPRALCSSCSIS